MVRRAAGNEMGSYASYLLETFVTLAVVCVLAFAVLYGARRVGLGRATGSIRLVGQLPLDGRRAIYLVRIGGSVLVVGASEGGLTKLGELPAAELPPEQEPKPLRFADVLARVRPPHKPAAPSEDRDES
ncbi:MAG TPA: flagellar biosynthetic protein FliO [Polyangiaceae bacterium]|nr:flagellar biosynthetic protein FliO [Polyangiaceae bacterium]